MQDLLFTLRVRRTALARLLRRNREVLLLWLSPVLFLLAIGIPRTERYQRWAAQRRAARFEVPRPGADPPPPGTTLIYPDMAPPDTGDGTADDMAPPTPGRGPRLGGQTGNGSGSYSPQGGGRPTLQYLGQPPRDPACDNVRLMDKARTTGQRLRTCAHDDPDPTCLHEAAPPGPVPTGAPTEPEPGAGEGGMRIRRQGRPRIPPYGQKPPVWPPVCPVCGGPGPDGRKIPSGIVPSPRPHARPHDSEETPQRANELERLAYAELLKDPFFKGDDPYDDISEDEERACKAARYPYEAARLPDVRHGLDEFKACRAVAAALLQSARSAQALRSVPTAYAYVAHRLDPLAPRALAAFREACRYHDASSCISYGFLRSSGFPTGAPTPKDREAGRSALVRGCKLAQMQAGVILSACTGEARPVPGKEVCEPEVEHIDDPRPRIGACLDGSKAPPPPPAPSPR